LLISANRLIVWPVAEMPFGLLVLILILNAGLVYAKDIFKEPVSKNKIIARSGRYEAS